MILHPADVAKEIKGFPFFENFDQELLMQAATLMKAASLKAGEYLLREGEKNSRLYFLRKGDVEIMLSGEVLANFSAAGEVFGEISLILGKPITTSVRAATDIECFYVNSEDMDYVNPKDRKNLELLLYRIYCMVLADRLIKTNEKARLFEILNREIHEAQQNIEKVGGNVLLIEPNKKAQMPVRMALGGTGVHLDIASDFESAEKYMEAMSYDTVLCEEANIDLLDKIRRAGKVKYPVLITNQNVVGNLDLLKKYPEIDFLLARNIEDANGTLKNVITTLSKLMNGDIFGLQKYLSWGVEVQKRKVKRSDQRMELKEELAAYFKKKGVRTTILDRVNSVIEEMLMNAIYDAPVDAHGNSLFNSLPRTEKVVLETHQEALLSYATDGVLLAVSVTDPFGALTREVIVNYLLSCYNGQAGSLNENKGGAGRGLHQIIENAEITIFNVKKGVRSEVICLFNIDGQKKEAQPSFHYFFT